MPNQDIGNPTFQVEQLRLGTRKQFESDWVQIVVNASATFLHGLGEIPWVVDVIYSEASDGTAPVTVSTEVSFTKSTSSVVVTTSTAVADDYYYQVRAL